jgi:hypothetical protein
LEMVKTSPPPFDLAETGLSSDAKYLFDIFLSIKIS